MPIETTDPAQNAAFLDFMSRNTGVTLAPVDIYVDPTNGDDANDGSQASPVASMEEVANRVPTKLAHRFSVHLRADTYVLPARGWWLPAALSAGGWIEVFSDEVWDPTVVTVLYSGTTQAGTDDGNVVTAGGLPADLVGRMLEFLDGPAAGRRVGISKVDGDTLIPYVDLNRLGYSAPGVGDSFRIVHHDLCEVQVPNLPTSQQTYLMTHGLVGDHVQDADHAYPGRAEGNLSGRIVMRGFALGSLATPGRGISFGRPTVACIYGVNVLPSQSVFPLHVGDGVTVHAGQGAASVRNQADSGLTEYRDLYGWGIRTEVDLFQVDGVSARLLGFWGSGTSYSSQLRAGRVQQFGGTLPALNFRYDGGLYEVESIGNTRITSNESIPIALGYAEKSTRILFLRGVELLNMASAVSFTGETVVHIRGGGSSVMQRSAPGAIVLDVSLGAVVYLAGDASGLTTSTGGVPVADWQVDGVSFDPLVSLASAGDAVVGPTGAKIIRVS